MGRRNRLSTDADYGQPPTRKSLYMLEAAYARSDLFKPRRRLIDDWAAYPGRPRGRLAD